MQGSHKHVALKWHMHHMQGSHKQLALKLHMDHMQGRHKHMALKPHMALRLHPTCSNELASVDQEVVHSLV